VLKNKNRNVKGYERKFETYFVNIHFIKLDSLLSNASFIRNSKEKYCFIRKNSIFSKLFITFPGQVIIIKVYLSRTIPFGLSIFLDSKLDIA
jgi:hypothetical protein